MLAKQVRRIRRFFHMVPHHVRAGRIAVPDPAVTKQAWENALILRLLVSEWCNYSCPYCPQTHGRKEIKGELQDTAGNRLKVLTAHAFDNFAVDRWIAAFEKHFSGKRISMTITGGEPTLDRHNFPRFLKFLTEFCEVIRIDTNLWWSPEMFDGIDKSKIILMCTFHPSQTKLEPFLNRVKAAKQAGFDIGMVNFVMNDENRHHYEEFKPKFHQLGIPLHPNPLWIADGLYTRRDMKVMSENMPAWDYLYRSQLLSPIRKPCIYPTLAYEIDYRGDIWIGCHEKQLGTIFSDSLPQLPGGTSVPCPHKSCVCLDKYSFLAEDVNRNVTLNPLKIYSTELKRIQKIAN
jgi:organic radical activating enzyme